MYNRIILMQFFLLFTFSVLFSQSRNGEELNIKKSEFKTEQEEGFKEAWKNLRLANDYFEAGVGTYGLARDHYLFAHQYNSENTVLNYRIGICYLYTDDKYQSLKYLRKAYDKNPDIHPYMHFHLGRAYHLVLDFDRALDHYRSHREYLVNAGKVQEVNEIDKKILECQNGKTITENVGLRFRRADF